ncbi:metallophosphoesterase domain-containing protein [Colletotrichum lupini]|uniref:Metallophosphoesterase domain-containing protein n=1 Tax=Colletotrichum lupini TaxID=145971 RepID=A0A9Q8W8J9_9PEZI|nr:metallophosphoesterase domain-containing protein [Colletotrichum lupini]UQC74016.1 metallophosphoesterase domain-containing protein [Colletotrichum lupini]
MPLSRSSSGLDAILNRPEDDGIATRLLSSPLSTGARYLYDSFPVSHPVTYGSGSGNDKNDDAVTVVCVSDTHNTKPRLPPGDILVHAGDLTASGTRRELREALGWIRAQPHRFKVVVAGNHDLCLDKGYGKGIKLGGRSRDGEGSSMSRRDGEDDDDDDGSPLGWGDIIYLNRTATTLTIPPRRLDDGDRTYAGREIRVYGSPYTPRHGNWAFQYPRSGGAAPYCSSSSSSLRTTDVDNATSDPWRGTIPPGTDVLVTHAPPKGHMDDPRGHWGCEMLLAEVWRARPRLHVFGHVHCGRGREAVAFDGLQAAYEAVVLLEAEAFAVVASGGGGGVGVNIGRRVGNVVMAWFKALLALGWCLLVWGWVLWWHGGRRGTGRTVFVNAAAVGGVRDRLVREAIVVRI